MARPDTLKQFATSISTDFHASTEFSRRLVFARKIAEEYKFEFPPLVLSLTHPEFATMTLAQRCAKLGVTEEQYLVLTRQKGFQKFVGDYEDLIRGNLRVQSIAKLSTAVDTPRHFYDNKGNITGQDLTVELAIVESSTPKQAQQPINLNFNMWESARQRLLEKKSQSAAIEIPATTSST